MTNEEKQLLLKDLAARVPYGLMIDFYCNESRRKSHFATSLKGIEVNGAIIRDIENNGARIKVDMFYRDCNIKPYLRPMSSMTEEEAKDYNKTKIPLDYYDGDTYQTFDWLDKHHFDYRGLISKGLALRAPDGMY